MLLMSVTLPKTQLDLCPVLDFRQSVEAIGLRLLAEKAAATDGAASQSSWRRAGSSNDYDGAAAAARS